MVLWKSLLHKLNLAAGLSVADWLALADAWGLLLRFHLALRWTNLERLSRPPRLSGKTLERGSPLEIAERLHRLVYLASRLHLLRMTCLDRSLALQWMLARRHIPARLQIGIQKNPPGVRAHAWVDVESHPVGEMPEVLAQFQVLKRTAIFPIS